MHRIRRELVLCLLALLLLSGMPGTADVLCVSATGHQAVEPWSAQCCLAPAGDNSAKFAASGECAGCTDYSLLPTADSKIASRAMWHPQLFSDSPVSAPVLTETAAVFHVPATSSVAITDPQLSAASLRC